MSGEKKIVEIQLEYGVRPARDRAMGTGTKLTSSSSEYDSSVPMQAVKAQAEALGNLIIELSNNFVPSALKDQFLVQLQANLDSNRSRSMSSSVGAESKRKRFLKELIKQFNPTLLNNDAQDVGLAIGLSLPEAEAIANELAVLGLIEFAGGLGGTIAPTEEGRKAAADPQWQ